MPFGIRRFNEPVDFQWGLYPKTCNAEAEEVFTASRGEKTNGAEQDETALKRNENFSLEIHIFFLKQKNVNHLRKIRVFQKVFYIANY